MNLGAALRFFRPCVYAVVAGGFAACVLANVLVEAKRAMDFERIRQAACARRAAEFAYERPMFARLVLDVEMAVDKCAALGRISPRLVLTAHPQGGPR